MNEPVAAIAIPPDTDPASLDMALLAPLQKQLQQAADANLDDEGAASAAAMAGVVEMLVQEQSRRLDQLAGEMADSLKKLVLAKRPIEDRWIDDERQFSGNKRLRDSKMYANDAADPQMASNGPVSSHATRSRTIMFAARLADMLLPVNDLPMRVCPANAPDPAQLGVPPQSPEQASTLTAAAAAVMQQKVFHDLRAAKFTHKARRAVLDACRIGCGILKGPFPDVQRSRVFDKGTSELSLRETSAPGLAYVDPWKFYYDMTPTLEQSSECHEILLLSARELREWLQMPRVLVDAVQDLLDSDDKSQRIPPEVRDAINRRNEYTDMREPIGDVYAVVETSKVLKPSVLKDVLGIDWTYPDPPIVHMWWCGGRCLKFKLTPLERDWRLPYYHFTVMPADDTIFGYGVPYMARAAQRFTDGAVNATLYNAAASVAPIIAVAQGKVQPNNAEWRLAGLNVFSVETIDQPMRNFIDAFQVPSNVAQNLELLQVAQGMMDNDTLFNQILQGNIADERIPASGLVHLLNISTVFQRQIASYADDHCFQPLAERLVWWQNIYAPDPSAQGDFDVQGIAATQMIAKDLAVQHLQVAMQLSAQPQFAGFTDAYEELAAFYRMVDFPGRDSILLPKQQAMQQHQQMAQQGDQKAAADMAEVQRKAQADQMQHQAAMAKIQSDERIALLQQQTEVEDSRARLAVAQMQLEGQYVALQTKQQVDLTRISAQTRKAAQDDATTRFQAVLDKSIEARLKMAELHATPSPYSNKD